ncbi:hypothetical protein GJ496_000613 [Pomphorhynchus laevis]|nr:hypothetical protein GJ496_000613 [Pomphorhynchus laevis]
MPSKNFKTFVKANYAKVSKRFPYLTVDAIISKLRKVYHGKADATFSASILSNEPSHTNQTPAKTTNTSGIQLYQDKPDSSHFDSRFQKSSKPKLSKSVIEHKVIKQKLNKYRKRLQNKKSRYLQLAADGGIWEVQRHHRPNKSDKLRDSNQCAKGQIDRSGTLVRVNDWLQKCLYSNRHEQEPKEISKNENELSNKEQSIVRRSSTLNFSSQIRPPQSNPFYNKHKSLMDELFD